MRMPSPPPSPTRRPKSSSAGVGLSLTSAYTQSIGHSHQRPSNDRRSSQCSLVSPSTPLPHDRRGYFEAFDSFNGPVDLGNAHNLGNLADELADVFDEEDGNKDDHEPRDGASGSLYDRAEAIRNESWKENMHPIGTNGVQNGPMISTSPVREATSELCLSPPKQSLRPRHAQQSSPYDGSDYGDNSDWEITHHTVLENRLDAVQNLTCQPSEANGSVADDIVQRVAASLKSLESQAGVENTTTRLITAHTALTAHVSYQTRTLSALTHPLVSPISTPPDLEIIDDLNPLLTSLIGTLPTTTSYTLSSLHNLHASTSDLISVLAYLSDTLHMMRQTTALASRRLRTARELTIEMRREAEATEAGIHWVERGNWECRLAGRECARVCEEVVSGFEEVCASWRKRLADGLAGVEVGAA